MTAPAGLPVEAYRDLVARALETVGLKSVEATAIVQGFGNVGAVAAATLARRMGVAAYPGLPLTEAAAWSANATGATACNAPQPLISFLRLVVSRPENLRRYFDIILRRFLNK